MKQGAVQKLLDEGQLGTDEDLQEWLRQQKRKPSKYRNKRTEYKGRVYPSEFQAQHAWELDLRVKAGEVLRYEEEITLPLLIDGEKLCSYRADFIVYYPDGRIVIEETKGFETEEWKLKRRALELTFLKQRPDVTLRVLKLG